MRRNEGLPPRAAGSWKDRSLGRSETGARRARNPTQGTAMLSTAAKTRRSASVPAFAHCARVTPRPHAGTLPVGLDFSRLGVISPAESVAERAAESLAKRVLSGPGSGPGGSGTGDHQTATGTLERDPGLARGKP